MTYHLHIGNSPTTYGAYKLDAVAPTIATSFVTRTIDSRTTDGSISLWVTSHGVPGATGVLYAGSTINWSLWLKQSNTLSVVYPTATLHLNTNSFDYESHNVQYLCTGTSTKAVGLTLSEHKFSCKLDRTIFLSTSDRFAVWPGYHVTTVPTQKKTTILSFATEGSASGAGGDSRVEVPGIGPVETTTTCPAANPADDLPDDDAINACLNVGGIVRLAPSGTGKYIIDSGLHLTKNTTTLISSSIDTRLAAGPNLRAPMLVVADGVSNYGIMQMTFDGNRLARTNRADCADAATRVNGENLQLRGTAYTVDHIISKNGLCGTSIEVNGTGYAVQQSQIRDNGFLAVDRVPGGLSDGITTMAGSSGVLVANQLTDNSDVDVRLGPANCRAYDNTITHTARHGFAGAMIAGGGTHSGYFSSNTITSTFNGLEFGLLVGSHAIDPTLDTPNAADATNNNISGAVVNLAIDGMVSGTIDRNSTTNAQGYAGIGGCPFSANYTAAHYDATMSVIAAGSVARDFHPGSCSKCGDGVVSAGEACDVGIYNGAGTSACCTSACQFANNATTCTAAGDGAGGLWAGESLLPDQSITSATGRTTLIYQLDGNLVLYQTGGSPLWASDTFGEPGRVVFGGDGNLVIYNASGAQIWQSNTSGYYGGKLVIEDGSQGVGDLVIYTGAGITPLWRASSAVTTPGVWGQNQIEQAAWNAGKDTPSGSSIVENALAEGKTQIDQALLEHTPINIVMRGIRNPNASVLTDPSNSEAKTAVKHAVYDAQHIVVIGNDHGFFNPNEPQWPEALTALALVNYANLAGVHVRIVTHSNGAASLGGMVEAADEHGLNQSLGVVKKVVMMAPAATDTRLHHIFGAFTTWWNQNQTRVDVIYGIQDWVIEADELAIGPGPTGINVFTSTGGMILTGWYIGQFFGPIGGGIGAAAGWIAGLFIDSPAERAERFLHSTEDNPWWYGGYVHVSFINQFSHNIVTYADNEQTTAALAYSQCVDGSRECIADCTVTVTPSFAQVPIEGGDVTFDVTTPASCAWTATLPELGISTSSPGNGTTTISFPYNGSCDQYFTLQVAARYWNGLGGGPETKRSVSVLQLGPTIDCPDDPPNPPAP